MSQFWNPGLWGVKFIYWVMQTRSLKIEVEDFCFNEGDIEYIFVIIAKSNLLLTVFSWFWGFRFLLIFWALSSSLCFNQLLYWKLTEEVKDESYYIQM